MKRLYLVALWTIIADIATCHLVLLAGIVPDSTLYYIYCISSAAVMALIYYVGSQLAEAARVINTMPEDQYITRVCLIFWIMMPFATKQVIDELFKRNEQLDPTDYLTLLILLPIGLRKYYKASFDNRTFNIIPKIAKWHQRSIRRR